MSQELQFHLDQATQDYIAQGLSPEDARSRARKDFGALELAKEELRDTLPRRWISDLAQDARFGLRMLRKSPLWSGIVCGSFALGIGLTTAIFSLVYSVLLQPLPYAEPDRLVALWSTSTNTGGLARFNVIAANWKDWREQSTQFEDIALVRDVANFNLTGDGPPERIQGARTSGNLTAVLGVTPMAGRWFDEEEDRRDARVAVLSHGFWQRRFAADSAAVGRAIQLNGEAYQVIGVMPASFRYPTRDFELWTPLFVPAVELAERVVGNYSAVGRLKPGVSVPQAQQEISAIMKRLEEQYPASNQGVSAVVEPLLDDSVAPVESALYVLFGSVVCLLLIVCMNLSVLLIARASARSREFSIRAALGASTSRIRRQVLLELLPLVVFGGVGGIALAYALQLLSRPWLPTNLPRVEAIGLHTPVLLFAVAVSLATVIAAALLPARTASRVALALQRQSRGTTSRGGARNVLVVAQVAVAMVLIFGGGLLSRSLIQVLRVDPGFSSSSVLTMHFAVTRARYPEAEQVAAYEQRLVDRIAAVPGVKAAAFINRLPLSGLIQTDRFEAEAPGAQPFSTDTRAITPQYFEAMRIPVLHGRVFAATDTPASSFVVIVDEAFARQAFGTTNVVGKRIRRSLGAASMEIVGVVGHIRNNTPEEDSRPQIYFSANQRVQDRGAMVIRTKGDPTTFTSAIIGQIHAEDPDQPVYDIRTMEDWVGRAIESRTLLATLVSLFSAMALALACLGVFGVVAYTASLRSREFGIRLALGAVPGQIRRIVLSHAALLVTAGLAIGGILLWPVSRLIGNLLFGIKPTDPLTLLAAPALLAIAGLAAAILPARRAEKTDPATALRHE